METILYIAGWYLSGCLLSFIGLSFLNGEMRAQYDDLFKDMAWVKSENKSHQKTMLLIALAGPMALGATVVWVCYSAGNYHNIFDDSTT